ncbi:DUF1934 domain-containing protein [Alkalicoccus luteus]|uniref:DUF1934 family protein n=1 Tax=Alkalicoccus luteus TaxID=1237094 RepID=A0A969TWK0_9BACI|nr:DUF1934 family protein [Alkalicoccus luteus]NJP37344.1 DUF1934 family protein [Alkalicoccus luteus]
MTQNRMPVDISIRTDIKDGKQRERHTMEASGEVLWRGDMVVLKFREPREENEAGTDQTMQYRDGRLSVRREGDVTMNQRFIEGASTEGTYNSQAGPMHMMTKTKELTCDWDAAAGAGVIRLVYVLTLQGSETGTYTMKVTFEEGTP